jgi:hypothetical protein
MRSAGVMGVAVMLAGAMLPVALAIAPATAQVSSLAMLDRLERGEWQIRMRDGGEQRRICLRSGHELIQLRHRQPGCSRYVVEDNAGAVTVQYSCPGNGYGRTSVRRESATLVQIESQGIADGRPFQFTAEARRIGACR